MAKKNKRPVRRKKARVAKRRTAAASATVHALVHELQVHTEEITTQNEQLLKAQHELEKARDRYSDLYDFAPTGYMSLGDGGTILDINLAGAALFGKMRAELIRVPVTQLIERAQRESMQQFLRRANNNNNNNLYLAAAPEIVEVQAKFGGRYLRLIARPQMAEGTRQLFTTIVDVTKERQLQDDRLDALNREQARANELGSQIAERVAAESRVKSLLERLVHAQEAERRRLSRNLHDHLGQQITVLKLTLSTLRDDPTITKAMRDRLAAADDIVAKLDRDVDLLAWDMRPPALDDLGLAASLAELIRHWGSLTQIAAEFHQSTPQAVALSADAGANLYRIVQEALTNIAKHSGATQVSVLLEQRGGETTVIIEDNGRGFNAERVSAAETRHGGMGLIGMRERAALLEGTVHVESAPGHGTTIFVRVPSPPAERKVDQ